MTNLSSLAASCSMILALLTGCATQEVEEEIPPPPTFTQEEIDAMTTEEKLAIYNKHVPAKEKLVCRKQKPTGSHRFETVCRTVSEAHDDRDAAETFLRDRMMRSTRAN